MVIREIEKSELQRAFSLVLEVFMEYEAPDYDEQGAETFKRTGIEDEEYVESLQMYGAFRNDELIGVIATRCAGSHIALFFVKGEYHRKGIGSSLFRKILENSSADVITVNSSPYAIEVYRKLGFEESAKEQTVGGVRFIPMVFNRN